MMKHLGLLAAMALCLSLSACGKKEESLEATRIDNPQAKEISTEEKQTRRRRTVSRPDCAVLDQPALLNIIFHPRRDPNAGTTDELDVFFPVAGGVRLGGRLHVAKKDSPVILFFHGNGEIASDYDDLAPLYTDMGVTLLVVSYRGYGKSGGEPTASDLLDDAMEVYRQTPKMLSERGGLDGSRLFLMGRSLGSAAASEIASLAGDEIDGLIIESGFASAVPFGVRIIEGAPEELKKGVSGFDNAEKIKRVAVPTLIIHGEVDMLVPVGNARTLHESSGAENKRLVIIPNAGHNDTLLRGRDIYFPAIRDLIFDQL
jgi:hypothetical protein